MSSPLLFLRAAFAVLVMAAALCTTILCLPARAAQPDSSGKVVEIKGEVIDTWCYFSGVMGATDLVTGTAHHTCALWCAAGGIPVGVRTEEGKVYMVLQIEGEDPLAPTDTVMELQTDVITARGVHYLRDGIDYLVVEKVVANDGITYRSHEDYGAIPPFSAPKNAQ
jgi:hypothetical protein